MTPPVYTPIPSIAVCAAQILDDTQSDVPSRNVVRVCKAAGAASMIPSAFGEAVRNEVGLFQVSV